MTLQMRLNRTQRKRPAEPHFWLSRLEFSRGCSIFHVLMGAKFVFTLKSDAKRRQFPYKILLAQQENETTNHILLKVLAYLLFFRERIEIEGKLHNENIPFSPDIVQLDYELRPRLWVECGECSINKLNKLAVKAPEAELWIIKRSEAEAQHLLAAMAKEQLRRNRYSVIGLDAEMFSEISELLRERNEIFWMSGQFDPPRLQFEFNGLWFDAPFTILKF